MPNGQAPSAFSPDPNESYTAWKPPAFKPSRDENYTPWQPPPSGQPFRLPGLVQPLPPNQPGVPPASPTGQSGPNAPIAAPQSLIDDLYRREGSSDTSVNPR